jgi:hypothetical protein
MRQAPVGLPSVRRTTMVDERGGFAASGQFLIMLS